MLSFIHIRKVSGSAHRNTLWEILELHVHGVVEKFKTIFKDRCENGRSCVRKNVVTTDYIIVYSGFRFCR